ncbi:hypothetical protein EJ07DRAFT_97231 [Lizonia empirigonia]|nr:hypothetical protein EJ07DRAFT_97231 [Lizonia empirigonia]
MSAAKQGPKKLLRASRACDFCHKRSIKCHPSNTHPARCQNCSDFDVPCTYDRPVKRGRAIRAALGYTSSRAPESSAAAQEDQTASQYQNRDQLAHRGQIAKREELVSKEWPGEAWRAFAAASAGTIEYLIHVYLQVAYPIFPLFHQPTLLQSVRDQAYLRDRGCFVSTMAACALASARRRDGALYATSNDASYLVTIPSETFYAAVVDTLPKDLTVAREFDYLRACALLSITSIQYGDIAAMQLYLGHYFTLVGIHRFHDETCWPKNISNIEVEERRRLYWSTYTLDVYASIVWNGSIHSCGTNARVRYPTEVEDELITATATLPSLQSTRSWLRGWNFTTDLYLTLEHASNRLRARHSRIDDRLDVVSIFGMPSFSSAAVLASITARYDALPTDFKMFAPPTGDRVHDIFGFQAANIQATLLLLRTIFLCADDERNNPSGVQLKCNVAAELLAVFQSIPTAYLCGISTPLIYHLAGIGTILGSVMEGPISEAGYQQVRRMLLSIADLLESLESGLSRAADISKGLRAQVEQIDDYMRVQYRPLHMASRIDGASAENENALLDQWKGEVQLPPELLDDWLWPFDLQPESWSFLGLA